MYQGNCVLPLPSTPQRGCSSRLRYACLLACAVTFFSENSIRSLGCTFRALAEGAGLRLVRVEKQVQDSAAKSAVDRLPDAAADRAAARQ